MLDFGDVAAMLRCHTELLSKANGRYTNTDTGDGGRRGQNLRRAQTIPTTAEEFSGVVPSLPAESASSQRKAPLDEVAAADQPLNGRPRKLEQQRVSIGPEKAWSIGAGELTNGQDGQVEKSITEVLAGVEPNARSRKASHSLRFFREGLPEEKGKRKESRVGSHSREKPSTTGEKPSEVARSAVTEEEVTSSDTQPQRTPATVQSPTSNRKSRTAARPPNATPISESPEDHSPIAVDSRQQDKPEAVSPNGKLPPSLETGFPLSTAASRELAAGAQFVEGVDATEGPEDGDDSGEEKISSAVFLPHQRLEDAPESPDSRPPRLVPAPRTKSRPEDFHPWLVKADDPEVDGRGRAHEGFDADVKPSPEDSSTRMSEPTGRSAESAGIISEEPESASHQHYEDHVHGHQLTPKQPLEAIELIPYKHQVGGHTTLWRFSKRAVCKQLNNRENEFYETVEKYHRDLLAFLPRYVACVAVKR